MNTQLNLSDEIQQKLICPCTKHRLALKNGFLTNTVDERIRYPIIDGIPILICNEKSLFSIDDFDRRIDTTFRLKVGGIQRLFRKIIPSITTNIKAKENYSTIIAMLPSEAKILVIGGSVKGEGTDLLYANDSFEIVGADVSFGPYATIICDAHDLPFDDESFDCIIFQAVLEHVLDPHRCVSQALRVLKTSGIIYAETPFMQQVHMKQYDFTRFTHLGHNRLFRNFVEISSGPICGPGTVLAWSYTYFLRSFARSRAMVRLLTAVAHATSFFLKYFDYYLIDKPGSYDAASAFFFMGRKKQCLLTDKELIAQFKGTK